MSEDPRYDVSADGGVVNLRDLASDAIVTIEPARGNTVTGFGARVHDRRCDLLAASPTPYGDNGYAGGIPVLFPFPNRVRAGRFEFVGSDYELRRNEHGGRNHIHGFVRSRPWTVDGLSASDTEGAWIDSSIRLDAFPEVMAQYPFASSVRMRTSLRAGVLTQAVEVRNEGERDMPMGYGIHPWFPARLSSTRAETIVRIPARSYWQLKDLLPTGHRYPVRDDLDLRGGKPLGTTPFDDVLTDLVPRPDGWTEVAVVYPAERLEIVVEASPEFREWVVFAPLNREVVCLEPYSCVTDAVNLARSGIDSGLVALAPGKIWKATVRLSARAAEQHQGYQTRGGS
jgi:aldose 1-epimerase